MHENQPIATLNDNSYTTKTGGIVTYNLEKEFATKKRKGAAGKIFSGSLYWIPEETHYVSNTIIFDTFKRKNGKFIPKHSQLFAEKFTKISGILHVNTSAQELVIKPGELFKVSDIKLQTLDRINGFVKPGDILFDNIIVFYFI